MGKPINRETTKVMVVQVDLSTFGDTYGRAPGQHQSSSSARARRFSGAGAVGKTSTNRPASSRQRRSKS